MRREGFCSGFRYNLAVRMNAFQCEMVARDGKVKFPDVRIERTNLARQAFSEAQLRGKLKLPDNPYIPGGSKEDLDPYTGQGKFSVAKKRANDAKSQQNNQNQQGGSCWEP
ncbi:hypothetical protein PCASD_07023 [Puccinia coronata f. sp. avenae]|uniref:Uncharacterized protein n=2 Tax=Puccinia coronata f. sp. avenae TaxID=200324 RepID=A0A2N5UZQ0_9BASI|nr:hypothetical protein PCASD_07023 [Puccinia coronata f. sp. avenae]